jgi:hypothetical protein
MTAHDETAARIIRYVREYNAAIWPSFPVPVIKPSDLDRMEIRSESYSNAHVEGEHEANDICIFTDATECGERHAAGEFVEMH